MTTPSGQISLDDVNTELSIAPGTQINMNAPDVRGLAGVPTGAIAMSDLQNKSNAQYVSATGGTITTSGDYKIHVFNSSGTLTVNDAGNPAGSTSVEYMVVAGGGGGGAGGDIGPGRDPVPHFGGGAGGGGFREAKSPTAPFPASPLATSTLIPVSVTSYPITVGGGGAAAPTYVGPTPGANLYSSPGSPSSFSSITSAGGGRGKTIDNYTSPQDGGSGGGHSRGPGPGTGGSGNVPPVSPPQGQNGGPRGPNQGSASGGGATGAGTSSTNNSSAGGTGATTSITASSAGYAGGASGGASYNNQGPVDGGGLNNPNGPPGVQTQPTAGAANTGGGGGGGVAIRSNPIAIGSPGGSGKVVIRYKFQ